MSYHGHQGFLERSSGKIISLSQQSSVWGRCGVRVTAGTAELPGVSILTPLTDAWFEPLAASQRVIGARFHAQATANEILLDVANLYINCWAISRSSMPSAFRSRRCTTSSKSLGISPKSG